MELIILALGVIPFWIIGSMAARRNRSVLGWLVVGLLLIPLASGR